MAKAQRALQDATGLTLETMGELEYYILSDPDPLYPVVEQQGYHESQPFSKWVELRREVLHHLATMGCHIKYAHSEVGNMVRDGVQMVQGEIEFLPVPINRCADELALAKWVFREVAASYGLIVTWAPKIIVGQAGSGMHFHSSITRDGHNVTSDANGLTDETKKVIAGFLQLAESLTAFGNTVPTSFLRLVPHQEAPTAVCWGESNRSALIRVPLGWRGIGSSMTRDANPQDTSPVNDYDDPQTFEIRSPDGSANIPMLLAGLAVAARLGLTADDALERADELHITGDASEVESLTHLPASCWDSADKLEEHRAHYEAEGIFPPALIDSILDELRLFNDRELATDLKNEPERLPTLVQRFMHVG